jgi:hypothetical protein
MFSPTKNWRMLIVTLIFKKINSSNCSQKIGQNRQKYVVITTLIPEDALGTSFAATADT